MVFATKHNRHRCDAAVCQRRVRYIGAYLPTHVQPRCWGINEDDRDGWTGGIYLQPLLDHPALDPYMRHPSTFPLVNTLLGGKARFAQFDFRETPIFENASKINSPGTHSATQNR